MKTLVVVTNLCETTKLIFAENISATAIGWFCFFESQLVPFFTEGGNNKNQTEHTSWIYAHLMLPSKYSNIHNWQQYGEYDLVIGNYGIIILLFQAEKYTDFGNIMVQTLI